MKIEKKPQRTLSELPFGCQELIEKLKNCDEAVLDRQLKLLTTWNYGKCELYHWIDVLNRFDEILERAWKSEDSKKDDCVNLCVGTTDHKEIKGLVVSVLKFSALLIEHSYARHVYNSMESLVTLLGSTDMDVIIAVLNLLYVFSKRSNFLVRLSSDQRHSLQVRLNHLAESWGGKENGFGLAQCCTDRPITEFPETATTLHLEFHREPTNSGVVESTSLCTIHLEHLEQLVESPVEIVRYLVRQYKVPEEKQMSLLSHVRLAKYFPDFSKRIQCVQSRLQAIAVLVYSNAGTDVVTPLLYAGFTEELVELLLLEDRRLIEVRAAALRTLTSIIHLERSPKLNNIIDATGAANYHGFLPTVARNCVAAMTDPAVESHPLNFSTALFSFIYHLASLDSGAGALLSCGILETLLKVINFRHQDQSHLTFVTRAVRIIDLITNLEMGALQAQNGLASLIARLQYDVDECRKIQPFELSSISVGSTASSQELAAMDLEAAANEPESESQHSEQQSLQDQQQKVGDQSLDTKPVDSHDQQEVMETDEQGAAVVEERMEDETGRSSSVSVMKLTCLPQRAALVKSILNFLKKCISDSAFADSIRTMMDSSLPSSLKHIISNAEFYGSALYYLATEVVTAYIFHEPSLLSSLQDTGLTGVMLNSLIMKDIPATRDVLGSLPNMLSALCLNARGLEAFVNCKPFDQLFKVMLLPEYLPAMRRRRSTDDLDDTATNLGSAMDELMRHQPTLKSDAMAGIVKLLQQLCEMGRDPKCTVNTQNEASRSDMEQSSGGHERQGNLGTTTDDEDEDDIPRDAVNSQRASPQPEAGQLEPSSKKAVPLLDYAHNVIRFLFSILNNNATDDHYREFVQQKGLDPLLEIPSLPNMPITFPISPACQSVAITCRGLLSVAVQPEAFTQCIQRLTDILLKLNDAWSGHHTNGSVLLHELASSANPAIALESAQMSPLLHCMVSAHSYINILSVLCKVTQSDLKTLMITQWTSRAGLALLGHLSTLCRSLIWECTVLLALCTPGHIPEDSDFGMDDIRKLVPEFDRRTASMLAESNVNETTKQEAATEGSSSSVTPAAGAVLEQLIELESGASGGPGALRGEEGSELSEKMPKLSPQLATIIKYIRPLLTVASRLGRSVSDIYSVLVRLFVIPQHQPRRHRHPPTPPKQPAWECVSVLTKTLVDGFTWLPPDLAPTPGFRLTLLLCFTGLTSSMLFDEQKSPYHVMLRQFTSLGGVDALLAAFNWAVDAGKMDSVDSARKASLYEDAGEFVDMWLFLMERMVNVNSILDSPHALLASWKPPKKFDPLAFLVKTHKVAFSAVSTLWGQKPVREVGQMSEAVLQILSHIMKGESQIRQKLEKQSTDDQPTDGSSSAAQPDVTVNESFLRMLSDMGFPESHCREALASTSNNWDRAMEYILSHPPAEFETDLLGSLGAEMSEEEQMARAIALSLGDNVVEEEKSVKETKEPEMEQKEDDTNYIEKSVLDEFTDQLLVGCLQLLVHVPKAVHGVCDVVTITAKRNGKAWKKRTISGLYKELSVGISMLLDLGQACLSKSPSEMDQDLLKEFIEGSHVAELVPWLHLFALLFEEDKLLCTEVFEQTNFVSQLVSLVARTATCLSNKKDTPTPKWLSFVILILDLYQNVSSPYYLKQACRKKVPRMWQFFDERNHRWHNYSNASNATLNDLYNKDEPIARVTENRRRCLIDFRTMMQTDEDTGHVRPVMFVETPTANSQQEEEQTSSSKEKNSSDQPGLSFDEKDAETSVKATVDDGKHVVGLMEDQQILLIRCATQLISVPVTAEALNAILRFCLRLTRIHTCAAVFTEHDGPKHLLSLQQSSAFSGFSSIITLIFRHILEDEAMLERTMESVVRSVALPGGGSSRELYTAFRKLGPAACRKPQLFTDVAMHLLRIVPSTKHQEETNTLPGRGQPLLQLKALAAPKKPMSQLTDLQETAVKQLLDALCSGVDEHQTENVEQKRGQLAVKGFQRQVTDGMDEQEIEEEMDVQSETQPQQSNQEKKASDSSNKPLLSKAAILKILAELVRCYPGCARLIAEYSGGAGESDSVLAYILDHLLTVPSTQSESSSDVTAGNSSDTASLARILLVTVSAVQHSPDAHTLLVNEVKAAFHRSLLMPECPVKHTRIQALAGLLSGMIEPSPPMGGTPTMTNVHKLLLRKGLLSDLARITHSLDLSSPSMANTINAVLKTLESLTFLVNSYTQKAMQQSDKRGEKKALAVEQSSDAADETQTGSTCHETSDQTAESVSQNTRGEETSQEGAVQSSQSSQPAAEGNSQRLHEEEHFADLSTLAPTYDADMEDVVATQDWDMSEVAATPQPQDRGDTESMSEDEVEDEVAEFEAAVEELLEGGTRNTGQDHFVVEEPSSDEEENSDDHEGSRSDGADESHSSNETVSVESEDESHDDEIDVRHSPVPSASDGEQSTEVVLTVETVPESNDRHSDRGEDYDVHIVTEIVDSPQSGDLEAAIGDAEEEDGEQLNETMEPVDGDEDIGDEIDDDDDDDDDEDEDDEDEDEDDYMGDDDEEGSDMEGDEEHLDEALYGDMHLMDDDMPHPLEEMLMLVADGMYDGRPPSGEQLGSLYAGYDQDLYEAVGLTRPAVESVPQQHPLLSRSGGNAQHSVAQMHQLRTLAGYPIPRVGARHRGQLRRVSQQVNTLTQPSALGGANAQPHAQARHLLGPAVAQSLFQLNQHGVTGRVGGQLTRTTPHVQVIPRAGLLPTAHVYLSHSHPRGQHFLNPFEFGPPRVQPSSSTIPSSLSRWTEESRLLDGEIAYSCLESCQKKVLELLRTYKNDEEKALLEEQQKKEEQAKTEAAHKKEEKETKAEASSSSGPSSQAMETEPLPAEHMPPVENDGAVNTTEGIADSSQVTEGAERANELVEPCSHSTPISGDHSSTPQPQQLSQEVEMNSGQVDMEQEQSSEVTTAVEQEQTAVEQDKPTNESTATEQRYNPRIHDEMVSSREEASTGELTTSEQAELATSAQAEVGVSRLTHAGEVGDEVEVLEIISQVHPAEMNISGVSNQNENASQQNLQVDTSESEVTEQSNQSEQPSFMDENTDGAGAIAETGSVGHLLSEQSSVSSVNGLSASVAALRPYSIAGEHNFLSNLVESSLLTESGGETVVASSSSQPVSSQDRSMPSSSSAPTEETIANVSSRLQASLINQVDGIEAENMSIFLSALQSLAPRSSAINPAVSVPISHGAMSLHSPIDQTTSSEPVDSNLQTSLSNVGDRTLEAQQSPSLVQGALVVGENEQERSEASQAEGGQSGETVSNSEVTTTTHDSSVLEGVDPSFLAALPEELREEVVADQLRMQRARQAAESRATTAAATTTAAASSSQHGLEVNPEVLAALPPNLQEEVLQQQRMMQAQHTGNQAPDIVTDPTAFLQNLPASLRQSLLTEMDDDTLSHLPAELTSEARRLRTQRDARHAQILHEQFLAAASGGGSLSSFLRSTGLRRAGAFRQHMEGYRTLHRPFMPIYAQGGSASKAGVAAVERKEGEALGKQLLDREALTCLLILLFINEPKVHMSQLQRVIKNLCQHKETRAWIISTLLSILKRTAAETMVTSCQSQMLSAGTVSGNSKSTGVKRSIAEVGELPSLQSAQVPEDHVKVSCRKPGSWLSLKVDATLGSKASVFQIEKSSKAAVATRIDVHPHAVPVVCRHVLDQLYCLVKYMPKSFMPQSLLKQASETDDSLDNDVAPFTLESDFWDILVQLDGSGWSRKGKAVVKSSVKPVAESHIVSSCSKFGSSPIGHLLSMLSHPVVRRSQALTDHLLKILSTLSRNLPESNSVASQQKRNATHSKDASIESAQSQSGEQQTSEQSAEQQEFETQVEAAACSTIAPTTATQAEKTGGSKDDSPSSDVGLFVDPPLLCMVVDVLTAGLCSEEGLEDATTLLLQLSRQGAESRENALDLMLRGTKELGLKVCQQVDNLLLQLKDHQTKDPTKFKSAEDSEGSSSSMLSAAEKRRTMQDAALASLSRTSKSSKKHMDLHLPAMSELTCKASTQMTFLRALKVVLQLRDSARQAAKPSGRSVNQLTSRMEQQRERLEELRETLEDVRRARGSSQHSSIRHLEQVQQALEDLEAEAGTLASSLQGINMMLDVGTREPPAQQADEASGSNASNVAETKNAPGDEEAVFVLPSLSELLDLEALWEKLSHCLKVLAESTDSHAVLVLQPTVEAFFLAHGSEKGQATHQSTQDKPPERSLSHHRLVSSEYSNPNSPAIPLPLSPSIANAPGSDSKPNFSDLPADMAKFLQFAETHRTVLNQILRQSTATLSEGPFQLLIDHTRLLDFDVKRRYFRHELERMDSGVRKDDMVIHVRRENVFEDSFRELHRRRPEEMKNRMYIVFEGEDGQDAGGLLREWFIIMSREMFNPNYALFCTTPGDRVTYMPNSMSHCNTNHLSYFKFIGRIIAKAIYDNKLLECYFSRSFYKHILGKSVHYSDLEAEDYSFYQGLVYLLEHDPSDMGTELTFSTEVEEFGVCEIRDLKENGGNIVVTEENKREYVHLVCQMKMTGSIRAQIKAFLDGFYEIIPKRLISIFNEQELELLIAGLPTIDIDDLKANTEYHKYNSNSPQIQWLWRALRSFDQADRAKFLQFVTGTSKVPLQGFASLEGMNGPQKFQIHRDDRSTSRLPSAHTCFNQLDLPAYESYEKLRFQLHRVVQECPEGFGLV